MSDQELHDFLIISIHAPPRGATLCRRMLRIFSAFQFTPLREGRHYTVLDRSALTIFQFTPLREGRRDTTIGKATGLISIHAPPRGATIFSAYNDSNLSISIHAPPRGATRNGKAAASTMADFNSRPSARGDLSGALFLYLPLFQFTPLREGRPRPTSVSRETPRFQFTPLREGRLEITESVSVAHSHFNSRPSARGDSAIDLTPEKGFISIHAPPRGATFPFRGRFRPFAFQFTPLREGRPVHGREKGTGTFISIHAPPRGATFPPLVRR